MSARHPSGKGCGIWDFPGCEGNRRWAGGERLTCERAALAQQVKPSSGFRFARGLPLTLAVSGLCRECTWWISGVEGG